MNLFVLENDCQDQIKQAYSREWLRAFNNMKAEAISQKNKLHNFAADSNMVSSRSRVRGEIIDARYFRDRDAVAQRRPIGERVREEIIAKEHGLPLDDGGSLAAKERARALDAFRRRPPVSHRGSPYEVKSFDDFREDRALWKARETEQRNAHGLPDRTWLPTQRRLEADQGRRRRRVIAGAAAAGIGATGIAVHGYRQRKAK